MPSQPTSFYKNAQRLLVGTLFFLNWEVVAGAIIWHRIALQVFAVKGYAYQDWLLGLAVFLIYLADRLIDARRVFDAKPGLRQKFYRDFRGYCWAWLVIALVLLGYILAQGIDGFLWQKGTLIGGVCVLYLLLVHKGMLGGIWKELSIAVVFTITIWGLPLAQRAQQTGGPDLRKHAAIGEVFLQPGTTEVTAGHWLLIGAFFLTTSANLLLISVAEYDRDRLQNQPNVARTVGLPAALAQAQGSFLTGGSLAILALWVSRSAAQDAAAAILVLHNGAHYWVWWYLTKKGLAEGVEPDYVRWAIDGLYLTGVFAIL